MESFTRLLVPETDRAEKQLIAIVSGTKAEDLITVLSKLPKAQRDAVQEVTLDMSPSMRRACESLFLHAKLVTNRFHVVRLSGEAMQKARIDQRWKCRLTLFVDFPKNRTGN